MSEHSEFSELIANSTSTVYTHGPDKSNDVITFHTVFPAVSLFLLLIRNYSRFFFLRVPGWDDLLLNVGWIFTAVMSSLICLATKYGIGRHVLDVSPEDRMEFLKLLWICQIIYLFATFFIKSAFFVFYARLASQGTLYYNIARVLLVLNLCIFVSCFFSGLFLCQPIAFFWNRTIPGGTCVSIKHFYISNASLNMLMDLASLILPVLIIWTSPSIALKKKFSISALFLLGIITCICSIMRIPTLMQVVKVGGDVTNNIRHSSQWSTIELNVALITACIPAIKPLIATLLGKATPMGSRSHSHPPSKPPPGVCPDSWATRNHMGNFRASVSVPMKINTRSHSSTGMVISTASVSKGRKGEHILLEETLTIEELNDNSRWAGSSQSSILPSGSKEDVARGRSRSGSRASQFVGGLRRDASKGSRS